MRLFSRKSSMKNGEPWTICIECGLHLVLGGANIVCVCRLLSNRRLQLLDCEDSYIALFIGRGLERLAPRRLFLGWLVHAEEKGEWEEQYPFALSWNLDTDFYLDFFLTLPNIFSWHIFHCHLKILLCNNKINKKNKQDSKNILNKSDGLKKVRQCPHNVFTS